MEEEMNQGQLLEIFVEDVESHARKVEGSFISSASAKKYNVVAYRIGDNLIRLDLWIDDRRKARDSNNALLKEKIKKEEKK